MPSTFNDLTFEQKKFLITFHGEGYALASGAISKTHDDDRFYDQNRKSFSEKYGLRHFDEDLSLTSFFKPSTWFYGKNLSALNQKREYNTLKNAVQIAEREGCSEVILLYGGLHLFTDVAKLFNINLTVEVAFNFTDSHKAFYEELNAKRPALNKEILETTWGLPEEKNTQLVVLGVLNFFNCCKGRDKQKNKTAELQEYQRKVV